MSDFSANLATCKRCPKRQTPCAGLCLCTVSGKPHEEHARAHDCPETRFAARGLGDVVAKGIRTATFGLVTPCVPCKERQAKLNALVPFGEGGADVRQTD